MSNFMVITEGEKLSIKAKAAKKQLKEAIKELKDAGVTKKQAIQLMANLVPVELEEYDQEVLVKDGKIILDFDDVSKKDLKKAIKAAKKQILKGIAPEPEEKETPEDGYFEPAKVPQDDEDPFDNDEDDNDEDDNDEDTLYCPKCDETVEITNDGRCVQCGEKLVNDDDRGSL